MNETTGKRTSIARCLAGKLHINGTSNQRHDTVQLFCGPDISLLQTHLFCKPQRCSATPWHQDGSSAEDIPLATVWITLDDITPPFSGGLVVLPGQHKHNLLPSEASDHFQFDRILPATYIAQQSPFRYPLGAGHAAIHHQWLPHASEPNLTLNYRRVIVLRFISTSVLMAEGVALWSIRNDGELARKCAIEEDGEAELYPDFRQEDVFIEGRNIILRGAH
ncbi:unnamed protein product [Aphanomyces euteiches]|nr:hypothetical protein AeRB84_001895 [Aphanomyces euteiches]